MAAKPQHRVPWTEAELAQLRSLIEERRDWSEIAALLGRSQEAIRTKAGRLAGCVSQRSNMARTRRRRRVSGASFLLS